MVLDDGYPKFDRGPGIPSEEHWADWEPTTLETELDDDPGLTRTRGVQTLDLGAAAPKFPVSLLGPEVTVSQSV